jgi:hypothetical protein
MAVIQGEEIGVFWQKSAKFCGDRAEWNSVQRCCRLLCDATNDTYCRLCSIRHRSGDKMPYETASGGKKRTN